MVSPQQILGLHFQQQSWELSAILTIKPWDRIKLGWQDMQDKKKNKPKTNDLEYGPHHALPLWERQVEVA